MATASAPTPLETLTVTDIKNWAYCPRVPFYVRFVQHRPVTFKMDDGQGQHEHVSELEERRSLRAYRLGDGERVFHVHLFSERLGLSGLVDMVIVRAHEVIPVEFKTTTGGVGQNHMLQLTAYGMLAEERWGQPAERGFVYLVPQKQARQVALSGEMRQTVLAMLQDIRWSLDHESKPPPTPRRSRCADCEYRRYCPDLD